VDKTVKVWAVSDGMVSFKFISIQTPIVVSIFDSPEVHFSSTAVIINSAADNFRQTTSGEVNPVSFC
jgi:hypothetical protein